MIDAATLETARFNMIEQQIRPWDVLDPRVLATLAHIKREHYVPEGRRALAFVDMEIPLGAGDALRAAGGQEATMTTDRPIRPIMGEAHRSPRPARSTAGRSADGGR